MQRRPWAHGCVDARVAGAVAWKAVANGNEARATMTAFMVILLPVRSEFELAASSEGVCVIGATAQRCGGPAARAARCRRGELIARNCIARRARRRQHAQRSWLPAQHGELACTAFVASLPGRRRARGCRRCTDAGLGRFRKPKCGPTQSSSSGMAGSLAWARRGNSVLRERHESAAQRDRGADSEHDAQRTTQARGGRLRGTPRASRRAATHQAWERAAKLIRHGSTPHFDTTTISPLSMASAPIGRSGRSVLGFRRAARRRRTRRRRPARQNFRPSVRASSMRLERRARGA